MPYPSQVTADQIITTAAEMIEADGVDALSLAKLAGALGVKAPSLYRYYNGKAVLLREINTLTRKQINAAVLEAAAAAGDSPRARLTAMAYAYRENALTRPAAYGLAYTNTIDALRVSEDVVAELWASLGPITAEYVGEAEAMACINGLWALSHGYVMLEICDNLRHDDDPAAVFARITDAYLDGWLGIGG